jgi:uncharacterized protein
MWKARSRQGRLSVRFEAHMPHSTVGIWTQRLEPLDAEIEWTEPPEFPGGGTYHGREAAKHYLTQSRAAWAEVSSEPERFITAGNRIVVFVHARVRANGGNEWQDVRLADVYTFRDGKLIQMRAFADRQEALGWVGVNDPGITP